jgi:hypothetical protein
MIETIKGGCQATINRFLISYRLREGDAIGETNISIPENVFDDSPGSFYGAIMPTNSTEAVFVPSNYSYVGLYKCSTNSFTNGPLHNTQTTEAFHKGVQIDNSTILFCPYKADTIGLYNYLNKTYQAGPNVSGFTRQDPTLGRFIKPVHIKDKVYLIPESARNIGIYNTDNNTISQGPAITHDEDLVAKKFSDAVQISDNEILLIPNSDYYFYIYNIVDNTITRGISTNKGPGRLVTSVRINNEVFISDSTGQIGVYNISEAVFNSYSGERSYTGGSPFSDMIVYGNKIILVPKKSFYVGEFNISTKTYTRGNAGIAIDPSMTYRNLYNGACRMNDVIVMAPSHTQNVGLYKPESIIAT